MQNGDLVTKYGYDAFSRPIQTATYVGEALVIGSAITYAAFTSGATSNQVLYYETGTNYTNVKIGYTYNGNGNIIREIRNTNRAGSNSDGIINDRGFVTAYQYDRQNRLTRENNELANKTWVWTYDNAGNITSKKEYDYSTMNFEGDPVVTQYTYGNSNWGDLLTSYNGRTITYDAIGNPLNDGIWSYTWEQGRLLTKMQSSSATWNYTYDTSGLRTSRSNGTTTYRYWYNDSGLLLRMEKGNTVYSFTYDPAGRPVSFTEGNDTYYYILNQQGDVIGIVDDEGIYIVSYVYDAWGQPVNMLGSDAFGLGVRNPLRYRGYVYDTETGLYYLQTRYYNPTWGRFINADDPGYMGVDGTPSSYNLFAYCGNNPVTRADEEGKFWLTTLLVGMASRYVGDVFENIFAGEKGFDILKPRSTVGEYLAAGVTALIPGKGLGAAIVRNIYSEGITNFEAYVLGNDVNIIKSLGKIIVGSFLDVGFEKALGFVNKCINSKIPGTYADYAHDIRKSQPNLSMSQVKERMLKETRFYRFLSEVVSVGSNAIRSCLFEI